MIAAIDWSQWGYVITGWVATYTTIGIWYFMTRTAQEQNKDK